MQLGACRAIGAVCTFDEATGDRKFAFESSSGSDSGSNGSGSGGGGVLSRHLCLRLDHCCVDEPSPSWELEVTTAVTVLLIGGGGGGSDDDEAAGAAAAPTARRQQQPQRPQQQRPSRLPPSSRLRVAGGGGGRGGLDGADGCPRGEFAFREASQQPLRCDSEIVNGKRRVAADGRRRF